MKIYRLNAGEFRTWRDHSARHELMKRLHAEHGITQVRGPSGIILGTARGDVARVPAEKARVRLSHHAVAPSECVCREWQKPDGKEDEHHPICALREAWEAQQAHDPDAPRQRAVTTATSKVPKPEAIVPALPPSERASIEQADTLPPPPEAEPNPPKPRDILGAMPDLEPTERQQTSSSPAIPRPLPSPRPLPAPDPAQCVCREWTGAQEGRHHRLCEFRERWEREHGIAAPQLVELESGEVVREATTDEAEASQAKEREDGVGAIELSDGKLYYVRPS